LCFGIVRQFVFEQGLGERLKLFQIDCLVEFS